MEPLASESQSFRIVRPQLGSSEFPPNACRGERCGGLGAQGPHQTGSGHGGKGFVGLAGFPERQQKNCELSGHSDHGPLLGPGGAISGEP